MNDKFAEAESHETGIGRRSWLAGATATGLVAILAGCATAEQPLSPRDTADVARIERYLNGLGAFEARFLQIWPDGGETTGTAFFDAPDKLRLAYASPAQLVMVATNGRLIVHDHGNDSVTHVSLANNPLGLLLRAPITLSGAVRVTSVQRSAGALQVSLARTDNPAQGLLTLSFHDNPLVLSGIEMVDAAGHDTKLRLYDQQRPASLDPALFDPATA